MAGNARGRGNDSQGNGGLSDSLGRREARWLALEAQGLHSPRPATRPGPKRLRQLVQRLGTVQLDAVNVVERTHFIVPFSRLGPYDQRGLLSLSGPGGAVFEYWGHAASLLPVEMYPLFRWRMEARGRGYPASSVWRARMEAWQKEHAGYLEAVRAEVRDRGPLAASQLSDPRRRTGEWWNRRSFGRLALEWLFGGGELAAWRAANFERVYDLPERVIPPDVLAVPTPTVEEAQRALVLDAARALGVATVADLADYFRLDQRTARARADELAESGALVPVTVEGWNRPAYVRSDARPRPPKRSGATLVSPFDSLIWSRERTRRVFDFDYLLEIYVPAPKRIYGYYVLPLLLGDRIVARLDVKADRRASVLRVHAAHAEEGVKRSDVAAAAGPELDLLREWLGLETVGAFKWY